GPDTGWFAGAPRAVRRGDRDLAALLVGSQPVRARLPFGSAALLPCRRLRPAQRALARAGRSVELCRAGLDEPAPPPGLSGGAANQGGEPAFKLAFCLAR